MKQILIPFLCCLLCSASALAERIDGPANVRATPNGQKLFLLYDDVEVSCTELKDDWYQIGIVIRVSKEYFGTNKQIPAGTKLYTPEGRLVGEALSDIKLSGASKLGEQYSADVIAYTYKSNIKPGSIPENPLRELLRNGGNPLEFNYFEDFIAEFDFFPYGLLHRFTYLYEEYAIYENWIDDISPMDRLRFIFEEKKLVAIIHTRDLGIDQPTSQELTRGRRITIFQEMEADERQRFIDLNIESYKGVD